MIGTEGNRNSERLRRLEAVTDAALSRLDADHLLDELLDRVRDLLEVDTAVILLLDAHARQLVPVAAKGLEDEVRRGLRVAVGHGFAGRVAQTSQPLLIADVTASDMTSPVLLEKGVRSLLGVPMFAGHEVIGVLHIGTLSPRRFTDEDVHLLELVADRASLACQARSNSIDQAAAVALQRGLLPTQLPRVPGVQLAARYVPGHAVGVGGDWFDVFTLPSGWLGVVIGDVSGHGLRSAVVMGRIRSALRAYALICDDPAQALTLLDRKVQHFEAGNLTTALYAMISPDRDMIHISVAGHPLPLLARPGISVTAPELPIDPPLGTGRRPPVRHHTVVDFPPGAVMVCFTDGLVERRDEIIDAGIARLADAVRPGPAEPVCAHIMSSLTAERSADDIALLVIYREPDAPPPSSGVDDGGGASAGLVAGRSAGDRLEPPGLAGTAGTPGNL